MTLRGFAFLALVGPVVDPGSSFAPYGQYKLERFVEERVLSERAKGEYYDEAANAFRTHYDDNGSWQGEYWGKTMLGAAATAALRRDRDLGEWIVRKAVAFVDEFQRPDGYICTYSDENAIGPNPDGSERFCWNLWSRKYTLWAILEASRLAESDPELARRVPGAAEKLLGSARRLMDHWIAQMEKGKVKIEQTGYFAGIPSMSVLKPLMLLYRRTGDKKYLDYARSLVAIWEREGSMPGLIANAFSGKPVSEWHPNPGWWAKAYEMMSCYEGLLDYADVTGERRLVEAVRNFADLAERYEGNPFGSVGYFDHFSSAKECPNATTEVCDVIHWMRLNHALFAATGDRRCIDRIENAYLNGFLPAIFHDGSWACHATRSHGTRQFAAPHQVGMKYHQCCVDNAPRVPLDLYESAAALEPDGTVLALLYFRGDYALGGGVRYRVLDYDLLAGRLRVAVVSPGKRSVRFRAPPWAEDFRVDGRPADADGWARAEAGAGETEFTLTYRPRVVLHEWKTREGADPRAELFEQVKETPEMAGLARREGGVYLTYGPFLLAKSTLFCASREECLNPPRRVSVGEKVSLLRLKGAKSRVRFWRATFGEGKDAFSVRVTDLQAHDVNDPEAAFSIWF